MTTLAKRQAFLARVRRLYDENPFPYLTRTDAQAPDKHVPTKEAESS